MNELILGMVGGLLIILSFISGVLYNRYFGTPKQETAEDMPDKERQKLLEQQNAFSEMMRYNINDAYGINSYGIDGGD